MKLSRESQESLKGALQAEGEEGTRSGKKAELLKKASFLLLAGHTPTDNILLQRFFSLSALMETAPLQYELVLPKTLTPEGVHVHLFMQHFVGNHVVVQLGCTAPVAPESPTSEKQGKKKRTVVVEEEKDEALQAVANEAKNSFNALMEDLRCINEERTTTTTGGKKGKRQRARSPEPSPAAVPDEEVSPNAECAAEAKTTLPPLSEDQPSKVEITRVASEPNIPPSYVREVTLRPTRSPEPFLQPPYTCAPAPASTNDYYYNPVAQPLGNFTECQGQVPQPYASRGAVHQNLYTAPYRNEITELRPPQMNTGALPNRPLNRFKFQVIAYSAQSNPPRPPQRAWEPMSGIPLQRPPAGAPQMFYDAPLSQPLVPQYGYRGEPSRASREYFNYGQGGGDYAPMNATNVSYDNPRYREPATQLSHQHGAYYQDYRPMPNPHYEPPPPSYHRETYPYDARVAAPPHFTNGPPPPPHDYTMPRPAANAFSRTPRPQSSFTRFEKSWW
ncbi:hypothetical protein, conserved [Angomonas deanei]|uniref:Uncharacterized protein n=1 Tax=Angomonas deanei TaxID=59799 RepID=A0A7G2CBI9_9TRYP|nr:hypothetical protein, conserved [Angomonas deanei]